MKTFYCPVELTRSNAPANPFFFIEVEAVDACDANSKFRAEAVAMMGGTAGYARWWPQAELPTFEYMAELRAGMNRSNRRRAA